MDGRLNRRVLGALAARLPDAALARVADPRDQARVRWPVGAVLAAAVMAIVAGRKSLAQMEALTDEMAGAPKRLLKLLRRIPDTTARDLLVRLQPGELCQALVRQVRAAHRRKALAPVGLPFGVVSMDGKFTTTACGKGRYVQRRRDVGGRPYHLVGTVTSSLISSSSKVCIQASPIRAGWGEQTHYPNALEELLDAYGSLKLFELVVYDAGACSRNNARYTLDCSLQYLMRFKAGDQPKLHAEARQLLGQSPALASTQELVRGKRVRRSVYTTEAQSIWPAWTGAKTLVRVLWEQEDAAGHVEKTDDRYYVTSLPQRALSGVQWLSVTRGHWAVENNCHHTWDAVLREDERPWIVADAQGMLAVMLLRRIAYNILTLFRAVTLRSGSKRLTPWRDLCRWFYNALIATTDEQLAGLRQRKPLILMD